MRLFALLALAGCTDFAEISMTLDGHTAYTYDERLPDALEQVFDDCYATHMIVGDEQTSLFAGSCPAYTAGSPEAIVHDLMVDAVPLTTLGLDLTRTTPTTRVASCDITFNPTYQVNWLVLTDLASWWSDSDRGPGLTLDFDFDEGWGVVMHPHGEAVCDFWWDQLAMDWHLGITNDEHYFGFSDPNLQFDITLLRDRGVIDAYVFPEVELGVLESQSTGLHASLDFLGGSSVFDADPLEDLLEASIGTAINGTRFDGTGVDAELGVELDALGEICDAFVSSRSELVIVADEDCEDSPIPIWTRAY